jgi:hypothetical protein
VTQEWVGWLWRTDGGFWERVCRGASLPECSRLLGRISRERGVRDALTVMTAGPAPPDPPPAVRRGLFHS